MSNIYHFMLNNLFCSWILIHSINISMSIPGWVTAVEVKGVLTNLWQPSSSKKFVISHHSTDESAGSIPFPDGEAYSWVYLALHSWVYIAGEKIFSISVKFCILFFIIILWLSSFVTILSYSFQITSDEEHPLHHRIARQHQTDSFEAFSDDGEVCS